MKRGRVVVVVGVAVLAAGLLWNPCFGDKAAKPKANRGVVAVLDVSSVLKENKSFKADIEQMKADVKKAEENVKKERDKIKAEREEMEKLPAGSDESLKKEEYLSKVEAALTASISLQKNTFLRREAAVYYSHYMRIVAEIESYSKENGIDIVMRTNNDAADVNRPDNVLARINRPIIWVSPELDITSIIAERVEKSDTSTKKDK